MTGSRSAALALACFAAAGCSGGLASTASVPECEPSGELVTIAQAVPTARFVPCIATFPVGWSFGEMDVREGRARYWLRNDRVGPRAVRVTLEPSCDTAGATELPSPGRSVRRWLRLDELDTVSRGAWLHEFQGGCVTHDFVVPRASYDFDAFNVELDTTLDLFSRRVIAEEVDRRYDAELDEGPASS